MKSILVSLVAILAATGLAVPISLTARQLGALGGATSPLSSVLSQVGKHVPSTMQKLEKPLDPSKKNTTQPGKNETKKPAADGLGGLTGLLGGLVPGGLVPGI
ncbi:hypothetical protein SAMD00023353_2800410 [Rosellinia necatrix]|uniref:Uncharacterized protein n=1 Tax=Rosellinia necatrix TaxID=77044 RepID=A0A1S8A8M3_ROSNE|nr:hypothetical protein SAMD00023353_2800410 [Rosellinia necatrix]